MTISTIRPSLLLALPLAVLSMDRLAANEIASTAVTAAVPVCEVIANPRKYDGHEIDVVGIYGNAPHQRILFDPNCAPGELALRIAEGSDGFQQDKELQLELQNKNTYRMKTVYRGRIEAEQVIEGCTEFACYRLAINDARLVSMEKIAVP